MRVALKVIVDGNYFTGEVCIEIPELINECFAPLRTCDDSTISYITGDTFKDEAIKKVIVTRKDAADYLARKLSNMIVSEMNKHDTNNGYPVTGEHE